MANEITIIDDFGQNFGLSLLNDKERLKELDNDQLEDLVYLIKHLKNGISKVDKELKERLDSGSQFKHITYGESKTVSLDKDNEKNKKAFVKNYGWGAVEVKTPKQLKELFGASIQDDLDRVVAYGTQKRVKYE
ncbi:hypothetical protein D0502_02045 [Leuconostoc falkenbergense]|uniref:Phage protein n=1 Tax=Leuconostoc falkenbergense TaxID=2766470 RepID=A0A9X3IP72_9LACO|nr:hypothetical protein [Leuconostoc falkenbergense]MCX7578182.1 hypothetical protein [Leuconostoc falkenbergense]